MRSVPEFYHDRRWPDHPVHLRLPGPPRLSDGRILLALRAERDDRCRGPPAGTVVHWPAVPMFVRGAVPPDYLDAAACPAKARGCYARSLCGRYTSDHGQAYAGAVGPIAGKVKALSGAGKECHIKEGASRSSAPALGRRKYSDSWRGYRSDMERQDQNHCRPHTPPAKRQGSRQLKRFERNASLGFLPIVDSYSEYPDIPWNKEISFALFSASFREPYG